MRKGLIIMRSNFRRRLTDKKSFLILLFVPILVVILGIAANLAGRPSFTIGILDPFPTARSMQAAEALKATDGIETEKASPDSWKTDMITGRYSAVVSFSKDSFQISSVKDRQTTDTLSYVVNACLEQSAPVDTEPLFGSSPGAVQRSCAFLILFLMITATINASLITKDKNNGTLRRIRISPCTAVSYVAGNMLFNFALTYFQFVTAGSVIGLLKLHTGISLAEYLIMGVWISLFTTAYGTCMASLFRQEMQVQLFASCISVILSLIGGAFIPWEKMPVMLQRISAVSPVRWFLANVNRMEQGNTWWSGTQSVLMLSLFIAGLFMITVAKNRKSSG